MDRKGLWLLLLIFAMTASLHSQVVPENHLVKVADAFIRGYLGDEERTVSGIFPLMTDGDSSIYRVELSPEGWLLMSRDWSAQPVLAYSITGSFVMPATDNNDNRYIFLSGYHRQLENQTLEKGSDPDPRWDPGYYYLKSSGTSAATVTVSPMITVKWNQGSTWNRFCPADDDGPGGHVYVGCVAVSMAQAMSVFAKPVSGTGVSQYYHPVYGTISVDFSKTTYMWPEMSKVIADDNNALLLYHCAVAVNMDFSPDGSGTRTSAAAATALKQYFFYSKRLTFFKRENFSTDRWKSMLDSSLNAGNPIVYSGYPEVGSTGHAFNIDGVFKSSYYHLNWGWGGTDDGYYTIDNLKPGGSDFTKGHTAIIGIQPFYYPTGMALSDTLVLIGHPAGEGVARFSVVDEAPDNSYEITLECDSTFTGTEWIPDYYLDGDSLRTSRSFERADGPVDTVTFLIKDIHDNEIRASRLLLLTASVAADDGPTDDSFSVYPVPIQDHFVITFRPGTVRIMITNLIGAEVAALTADSGRVTVSAVGMPPGMYVVTVTDAKGKRYSKTVVKN